MWKASLHLFSLYQLCSSSQGVYKTNLNITLEFVVFTPSHLRYYQISIIKSTTNSYYL